MTPETIPTFFYRGTRTHTEEKGNRHQYPGWRWDRSHGNVFDHILGDVDVTKELPL